MAETGKAVFLSYASQDAEAAKKICEALRAAGVEVWFDQNELVGGDAWDAKIRGQISSCALFMPIISANTQARLEGYFRIEWKLAAKRTHAMATAKAFLLPIVIDGTHDAAAHVPDEFREVQWTRIRLDETPVELAARVTRLLSGNSLESGHPRPADRGEGAPAPGKRRERESGLPRWARTAVAVIGAVCALLIALAVVLQRREHLEPVPAAATPTGINAAAPTAPQTEAQKLVQQAKKVHENSDEHDRETLNLADDLVKRALVLDAASPAAAVVPKADEKSVAVLAFANLSDDKANEYFSDGISEELLNVLAKVPGLKVTARTSSFSFKGKEVPVPEIAKQLSVAYVIEGSVRKSGDKVRITAQLIKAADGFHVWSDTFTRDLKDVFAVQDEIAGLIAQQLQLKLGGTSRANQLVNPEAYDLYLRARALSRLEDENYLPMIKLYEAAVAKDPEFFLAQVQLSLARASDYWSGGLDSKPAARAALQAAQRLAPDAPETRLAAGSYAYSCENDWNLARTEFLAAEAGLPGDAQVAFFVGMVQRRLLNLDASIRQVARAIELDPADRNNFAQQAHSFKALRRYPELVDLTDAALKRFPADEYFLQTQAIARCEIDRDQGAFLRRLRELPAVEARARVLKDYYLALHAGEWEAAGRILVAGKLDYLSITPATTRDPIAMQLAMLAHLQGRPELAQRFGAEALAFYQTEHWSLRQDKWMKLGQAQALAYAGRGPEAVGLARETLAATAIRDPWDTVILHTYAAQVYLVAGHRDEAFAELRIMMTGPCLQGVEELRRDPLWRTVKDDPRFEEILRSAKRL